MKQTVEERQKDLFSFFVRVERSEWIIQGVVAWRCRMGAAVMYTGFRAQEKVCSDSDKKYLGWKQQRDVLVFQKKVKCFTLNSQNGLLVQRPETNRNTARTAKSTFTVTLKTAA